MRTGTGGYLVVLGDRHTAWAGVHVRVSRFDGAAWQARAGRLLRHGRHIPPALRLISSHYVEDPARVSARLGELLGPRFARRRRAGEARLRRALTKILAEDQTQLEGRFDPATGLFRTPGDALPGPAKRLVARLAEAIVARTPGKRRTLPDLLRRPYGLGLLWPLLGARLEEAAVPGVYRPEVYRALVRALAGCHFTDAEMTAILGNLSSQPAEYRVGAWEYRHFARRGAGGREAGLDRFAFYLLQPRDHILRGVADYKRRAHGALPVRAAIGAFRVLQFAALGAAAGTIGWLILEAKGGLMPGLTLLFTVGAAIPAGRLYRRPDMARLMGHVSERDVEAAPAALEGVHPHTLEPVRPALPLRVLPEELPAAVMPLPHGTENAISQPADVPSPIPVPAARPAGVPAPRPTPEAEPPAAGMADIAAAYIATPIGPIPFPVPRAPGEDKADVAVREEGPDTALRDETADSHGGDAASDAFALGWGMPIPVPNWMAAIAPETVPVPPADTPSAEPVRSATAGRIPAPAGSTPEPTVFHAPPLPPVLPSPAFWGIEGASLHTGPAPRPGDGDGSRHRHS